MVKPNKIFLIALLHTLGFICANLYHIVRLHVDGTWGSNGTGLVSSYGFPAEIGVSQGCFSGPNFYYGNLFINLLVWNVVAVSLMETPFLISRARIALRASVSTGRDAFNYGGLIADESDL